MIYQRGNERPGICNLKRRKEHKDSTAQDDVDLPLCMCLRGLCGYEDFILCKREVREGVGLKWRCYTVGSRSAMSFASARHLFLFCDLWLCALGWRGRGEFVLLSSHSY